MGEFVENARESGELLSIDAPDYEAITRRLAELLPITTPDLETVRMMGKGSTLVAMVRFWAKEVNQTDPDRVTRELFGQAVLDEGKYT